MTWHVERNTMRANAMLPQKTMRVAYGIAIKIRDMKEYTYPSKPASGVSS